MAIPPEPIEELLTDATMIVEAEVSEVVSTGAAPPRPEAKPTMTSVGYKNASQVVKLKVKRALKGNASGEITVEKPVAGYTLKAGNSGAFFLRDAKPHPTIIGRYGPDTYRVPSVEQALSLRATP